MLTEAPAAATAEVVSSLNDDGSIAAFSFPRLLSGPVSSNDLANNSEIYITTLEPRPAFGTLTVFNGASHGNESGPEQTIAPDSIAIARGSALAARSEQARAIKQRILSVCRSRVPPLTVNGRSATILLCFTRPGHLCSAS